MEKIEFRAWVERNIPIVETSNNSGGVYEKVLSQFITILVRWGLSVFPFTFMGSWYRSFAGGVCGGLVSEGFDDFDAFLE